MVCLIIKSCWRNHREGTSWTQNSWFPWSSSQWVCPPHMSILCHLIPWLSTYHLASRFMPCTGAKRQPEIAMNMWSVGIPVLPRAEDLIGALTYILRCVSHFFFSGLQIFVPEVSNPNKAFLNDFNVSWIFVPYPAHRYLFLAMLQPRCARSWKPPKAHQSSRPTRFQRLAGSTLFVWSPQVRLHKSI